MSRQYRKIIEHKSFEQCVQRLGGARRIDTALTALATALAFWPDGFPLVGDTGLRIAKTDPILTEDGWIPPLRLFFQLADAGNVELWWIEEIPEDEEWPS